MKEKKIVFVCTGNTCRSPMAEVLFNLMVRDKDTRAVSCGILASNSAPASTGAQNAVKKYGADLSSHIARPVTEALLEDAVGIYCMTSNHAKAIASMFPEISHLVYTLDKADISDPFGGYDEDYQRAAEQIYRCVKQLIDGKFGGD